MITYLIPTTFSSNYTDGYTNNTGTIYSYTSVATGSGAGIFLSTSFNNFSSITRDTAGKTITGSGSTVVVSSTSPPAGVAGTTVSFTQATFSGGFSSKGVTATPTGSTSSSGITSTSNGSMLLSTSTSTTLTTSFRTTTESSRSFSYPYTSVSASFATTTNSGSTTATTTSSSSTVSVTTSLVSSKTSITTSVSKTATTSTTYSAASSVGLGYMTVYEAEAGEILWWNSASTPVLLDAVSNMASGTRVTIGSQLIWSFVGPPSPFTSTTHFSGASVSFTSSTMGTTNSTFASNAVGLTPSGFAGGPVTGSHQITTSSGGSGSSFSNTPAGTSLTGIIAVPTVQTTTTSYSIFSFLRLSLGGFSALSTTYSLTSSSNMTTSFSSSLGAGSVLQTSAITSTSFSTSTSNFSGETRTTFFQQETISESHITVASFGYQRGSISLVTPLAGPIAARKVPEPGWRNPADGFYMDGISFGTIKPPVANWISACAANQKSPIRYNGHSSTWSDSNSVFYTASFPTSNISEVDFTTQSSTSTGTFTSAYGSGGGGGDLFYATAAGSPIGVGPGTYVDNMSPNSAYFSQGVYSLHGNTFIVSASSSMALTGADVLRTLAQVSADAYGGVMIEARTSFNQRGLP